MKNKFFAPIAAVFVSIIVIAGVVNPILGTLPADSAAKDGQTDLSQSVFMFFVTDSEYSELKSTLHKLEKEYNGSVEFVINNVDRDKSLLNSYPVENNTPALIMLDENSDIVGIHFKVNDYVQMRNIIEDVINNKNEG